MKIFFLFFLIFINQFIFAITTNNQNIHIQILENSEIEIIPSTIKNFNFDTIAPGGDFEDQVDNSTYSLNWATCGLNRKITVETNISTPLHTLKIEGVNVEGGVSNGEVSFLANQSTETKDLIKGISQTNGSCSLTYTASVSIGETNGDDQHTITYTITAT